MFRRAGAEGIGTYFLVLAGCGAIIVESQTGALTHVGVALTFGLIVMVLVASLGQISGAHFNPAVTLGLSVSGYFNWREAPLYIAAQLAGAIGGAVTLRLLFGLQTNLGATLPAGSALQSFGLEVLLTAILIFVIMAVATDKAVNIRLAALAIGGAVALDALWGGPISGASMNPARSFGPALVAGLWQDHWVYWIGPILGACLAAFAYRWLFAATGYTAGYDPHQSQSSAPES